MSKRPVYGGIPASAEAAIEARRRVDARVVEPPPAPPPKPALIETRLKAIEDKLDLIIDLLTASSADDPPRPAKAKQRKAGS